MTREQCTCYAVRVCLMVVKGKYLAMIRKFLKWIGVVLGSLIGLLVLAFAQVDMDIGVWVAAQGQHKPYGVGWTRGHGAMEREALLVAAGGCCFGGFFGF